MSTNFLKLACFSIISFFIVLTAFEAYNTLLGIFTPKIEQINNFKNN